MRLTCANPCAAKTYVRWTVLHGLTALIVTLAKANLPDASAALASAAVLLATWSLLVTRSATSRKVRILVFACSFGIVSNAAIVEMTQRLVLEESA